VPNETAGARLPQEAIESLRIPDQPAGERLYCHALPDHRMHRLIHDPHPAAPHFACDLVLANPLANEEVISHACLPDAPGSSAWASGLDYKLAVAVSISNSQAAAEVNDEGFILDGRQPKGPTPGSFSLVTMGKGG
jgi:hypothetical protein